MTFKHCAPAPGVLLEVIFVCGDGVVLLDSGSPADVVDDVVAAAVAVEVLDPTEGEKVSQASAASPFD